MKTPSSLFASLPVLAAGVLLASAPLLCAQNQYWNGANNTGGDGDWNTATNWATNATSAGNGDIPDEDNRLYFDYSTTYTTRNAEVTIGTGIAAKAAAVQARYGKNLTLTLEEGASLTLAPTSSYNGYFNVGGSSDNGGAVSAKIQTLGTNSATVKVNRIYLASDTGGRKTMELSGQGLNVEQNGPYAVLSSGASLILSDGAKFEVLETAGETTSGNLNLIATSGNGINNRLLLEKGTLSVTNYLYAYAGSLVQLSKDSVLQASGKITGNKMSIRVNQAEAVNGGRFEAEGSGLDASVETRVYKNGVLAIGLSDPDTGERTEAGKLTLNSEVNLYSGSIVEISLFGSGDAEVDQINFTNSDTTAFNINSGALLDLKLNGYTPTLGESWTLFTGETSKIAGVFSLDLIDQEMWDLSNFNETGGWVIVSQIPEPSGIALLLVGGTGMLALLRRSLRRHRA